MKLVFPGRLAGRWQSKELAHSCPSVQGEPGRRGLSAARGITPHPRAEDSWPITCQGSGTTAVPTARAQTLIQENKVSTLCSEFQSVPHAAGKSRRQAFGVAWLAAPTLDQGRHQELL